MPRLSSTAMLHIRPESYGDFARADWEWYIPAMERLVMVVQELSHARTMQEISIIVRDAARALTGADGATFVLRDGDKCFYADESAIAPLWKGRRFPLDECISGWVMKNGKPAVIEDIYNDERIPVNAYRPTFVKSLAMVPIRKNSPIGAIGNYWASHRRPTLEEISILQALANTTAVAIENANLYSELDGKIKDLEDTNSQLSYVLKIIFEDLDSAIQAISDQLAIIKGNYSDSFDSDGRICIQNLVNTTGKAKDILIKLSEYKKT